MYNRSLNCISRNRRSSRSYSLLPSSSFCFLPLPRIRPRPLSFFLSYAAHSRWRCQCCCFLTSTYQRWTQSSADVIISNRTPPCLSTWQRLWQWELRSVPVVHKLWSIYLRGGGVLILFLLSSFLPLLLLIIIILAASKTAIFFINFVVPQVPVIEGRA